MPNELVGLAKRRICHDRISAECFCRLKKVDRRFNVIVCAFVSDQIRRPNIPADKFSTNRATTGAGLVKHGILIEASGADQGARGARRSFIKIVATIYELAAIGALPHWTVSSTGNSARITFTNWESASYGGQT